jgi:ubiquinone biosynthesis protein
MDISIVPQLARNSARFREVVSTLAKYGLANWLSHARAEWVQQLFTSSTGEDIQGLSQNERIRLALTELGTTFIKLGQVLSTRPDLVGPELAKELTELQSNNPADSPEVVRRIIQDELQRPVEDAFAEFDEKPLASASIAQVHLATLHSGASVVVKVQHQGIEDRVRNDLEILTLLAGLAEQVAPATRQYQPKETAEEFSRTLLYELDFTREAGNLRRFTDNFSENKHICIPAAHEEQSSQRVLAMDFLKGISLTRKDALLQANHDLKLLAKQGAQMFVDMIFRDGFYHADPHPGNLLVLENGSIGLLDCGMVGQLDDDLREQVEDMVLAVLDKDAKRLTGYIMKLGQVPQNVDRKKLGAQLEEFLAEYGNQSIADFDLSGALNGMVKIIRDHQIILPAKIGMLVKVLVMLEGTAQQLNPDFSLAELLSEYKQQAIRRRLSPQRMWKKLQTEARDWGELAERFPGDAVDILERIKKGSFDVHLDHRRLDSIVNRLVLGILAAALFMGSTLLWSQSVPPLFREVSIPGSLGCVVSAFFGFKLIRAIKKSGDIDNT